MGCLTSVSLFFWDSGQSKDAPPRPKKNARPLFGAQSAGIILWRWAFRCCEADLSPTRMRLILPWWPSFTKIWPAATGPMKTRLASGSKGRTGGGRKVDGGREMVVVGDGGPHD